METCHPLRRGEKGGEWEEMLDGMGGGGVEGENFAGPGLFGTE